MPGHHSSLFVLVSDQSVVAHDVGFGSARIISHRESSGEKLADHIICASTSERESHFWSFGQSPTANADSRLCQCPSTSCS